MNSLSQLFPSLLLLLQLALAAAAGGMLRFAVSNMIARKLGVQFPIATLLVNASGALAIGIIAALPAVHADATDAVLLATVGFLGSYTTVSSFSLQTISLWQSRLYQQALLNIGLSVSLCLSLTLAGFSLGRWLW